MASPSNQFVNRPILDRAKREGDTLQEPFEGYCRQQREGRATSKAS